MRRSLAVAVAVFSVAACSKQETPAADSPAMAAAPVTPAPLTNADLAGTWEAVGMPMDRDTVVVRFTWDATDTGEGTSITFASGEKVVATARQLSGDSVVTEAGPFKSQVRKGVNVTSTRMVLRKQGDQLVGMSTSKYSNGDTASFRITATKKP